MKKIPPSLWLNLRIYILLKKNLEHAFEMKEREKW
jgi:hypothetical protein